MSKGDLLVRLKTEEEELERQGRVAERERIQANLENARIELERVSRLHAASSVAQRTYDVALYAHRALTQALLVAESQIALLVYRIDHKTVRAPFDGFVAAEHTEVGQWIQPGGPVVTLVDLSQVRVAVDLPERHVADLAIGARVQVSFSSLPGEQRTGAVHAVLPQGNPMTRTFPVRVRLDNPNFILKAGMEAMATFDLAQQVDALMVPKDAVVTAGEQSLVFRVSEDRVQPVTVQVTGYHGALAAVSGALQPGDTVVVRGNERLRPGQAVVPTAATGSP